MKLTRNISISIHDYNYVKLCGIYDSNTQVNGQAYDIFIHKEANGWKELTFSIPVKIRDKTEFQNNPRIDYLKNEYLVCVQEKDKKDWYFISEPNISHKKRELSLDVTCGHISSLLRTRNLYLELDDTNGIGTCSALATTILSGTGWTLGLCDTFYEKDLTNGQVVKVRTLKSSNKTGAFQMIQNLCVLFNARPTFNGDTKTVDIHAYSPLNMGNPTVTDLEKIMELNYGKAMGAISRKLDTEKQITRLHVEGEYGDNGYIGIEAAHPHGLNFLTDFSYFEGLGLFTATHQTALDEYIQQIKVAKPLISSTMTSLLEKETQLMTSWGTCDYGCYNVTSVPSANKLNISFVCSNVDMPEINAGDGVVLQNTNGTHVYTEVQSRTVGQITIKDGLAVAANKRIIVFFTKAIGVVGGKESALIAAQKTRKTAQDKLDVADTEYTRMFVEGNPPTAGMVSGDLWVNSALENFTVFRYLSGNWSTPVRGTIASSAINVAKADIKISALLNGTVDSVGLYVLMKNADILAREISALYTSFEQHSSDVDVIEGTFSVAMGDMLRDGYWNDSNYVVGQENNLYADAQEIMRIMAQPDSTYSVKFIELSEAASSAPELTGIINVPEPIAGISFPFQSIPNDGDLISVQTGEAMHVTFSLDSGYLFVDPRGWMTESYVVPSWKDIDLDFSVHIIDEEIGISVWGFVDKVIKCYDKPWQTTINVSTKESDIGSKTFTDILASIASIAEEVRGKSDVYDRSRLISSAKTISATALQGIIDVNRTSILATASNWGTDVQGNIVFTAQDNSSAMMQTGTGFMIANKKTLEDEWDWRTKHQWFSAQ